MTPQAGPDVGDLIDGRYRIERTLGAGGSGRVAAARDERDGMLVALKLVPRPVGSRDLRRWARERLAMETLAHANLARFVASGDHDDSLSYVAMELVDGDTLASRLESGGALEGASAIAIARDVARGLDAMHRAAIVHRDVKPANIVLTRAGDRAVLVDFGIALACSGAESWSRLTRSGTVVGTAGYLAPERIEGAPGDARADLWSLGIVLYEMLTGRPPFRAKNATRTMMQILTSPVPPLPDALAHHAVLTEILGRSLARNPDARFASAASFDEALGALPSSHGAAVRSIGRLDRPPADTLPHPTSRTRGSR